MVWSNMYINDSTLSYSYKPNPTAKPNPIPCPKPNYVDKV